MCLIDALRRKTLAIHTTTVLFTPQIGLDFRQCQRENSAGLALWVVRVELRSVARQRVYF
eukprot:scaffold13207_cov62-Phaeocystis_antarctica.AAC.5